MRLVLAPNAFRDGPSARTVAAALARGARSVLPGLRPECVPLADGGDGTLEVVGRLLRARIHEVTACDPRGERRRCRIAMAAERRTAVIEMAEASGLRRVAPARRDPYRSSTYGTGELIRAALDLGAERVLLGAGGSGTIDAGAGALAALGAVFRDDAGRPLEPSPAGLRTLARVDLCGLDPRLAHTEICILGDVDVPLRHNLAVFGVQKGVRPGSGPRIQAVVERIGALAREQGVDTLDAPWMGAGGGLAAGLSAFAGARSTAGGDFIAGLAGLGDRLRDADLLLTGEGCFDGSSLRGKVPGVACDLAGRLGIPVVVVAGQVREEPRHPAVLGCVALRRQAPPSGEDLRGAGAEITRGAEAAVRFYLRGERGTVHLE